jgi:hypothetical protein
MGGGDNPGDSGSDDDNSFCFHSDAFLISY